MGKGQLRLGGDGSNIAHRAPVVESGPFKPSGNGKTAMVRRGTPRAPQADQTLRPGWATSAAQPQRAEGKDRVRVKTRAPFTGDPLRLLFALPCLGRDGAPRHARRLQRRNVRRDSRNGRDYSACCSAGGNRASAPSLPPVRARSALLVGSNPTPLCQ